MDELFLPKSAENLKLLQVEDFINLVFEHSTITSLSAENIIEEINTREEFYLDYKFPDGEFNLKRSLNSGGFQANYGFENKDYEVVIHIEQSDDFEKGIVQLKVNPKKEHHELQHALFEYVQTATSQESQQLLRRYLNYGSDNSGKQFILDIYPDRFETDVFKLYGNTMKGKGFPSQVSEILEEHLFVQRSIKDRFGSCAIDEILRLIECKPEDAFEYQYNIAQIKLPEIMNDVFDFYRLEYDREKIFVFSLGKDEPYDYRTNKTYKISDLVKKCCF